MVKNDDGKVAMVYYMPMPKTVSLGDKNIFFDCQHGISMAFVDEADTPPLLDYLGGCCGGKKHVIFLASEVQYAHWKDGQGGR